MLLDPVWPLDHRRNGRARHGLCGFKRLLGVKQCLVDRQQLERILPQLKWREKKQRINISCWGGNDMNQSDLGNS